MQPFRAEILSSERLVVATISALVEGNEIMASDFHDNTGIYISVAKAFLGMDHEGNLRLGRAPMEMHNGIWYMNEDESLREKFQDYIPDLSHLDLVLLD